MTTTQFAPSQIHFEVERIRELSRSGRHSQALSAAEALAAEAPESREALYLVAANERCLNLISEALATLGLLDQRHPRFSLLCQERGHCYVTQGDTPRAIDAFQRAVGMNPALLTSWIMLERLYRMRGDLKNAAIAVEQISVLKQLPAEIVRAGSLFSDGDLSAAEKLLRMNLQSVSNHVEGQRLLARIRHQLGALDEAELLLEGVVKRAPNYRAAQLDYVRVLIDRQKYAQAHQSIQELLNLEPHNESYSSLSAIACAGLGRHQEAITLYRQLLGASPQSAELHVSLGHSLKSAGQQKEAIEAYRMAANIRPSFGDAYWSLANLKTYRLSDDDIAKIRATEAAPDISPVDRYHFCFALGKAYEDRNEFSESWQFYERGNGLKRSQSHYDPEIAEADCRKQIELCTAQFFDERSGSGAPDHDPIFIVGLPRSGSTLIEQILASHSQVEGTQELYDIPRIAVDLRASASGFDGSRYPQVLSELATQEFEKLAKRYLTDTRAYRQGKPFFVDKMPNNFRHIALIHLMLPNAKIIDVRREPMACCFSNLKQLFASGQEFTYSIEDIARYYRSYLDLMRHWDAVLPGRVLRVWYEDVVDDLAGNVRRILEFCRLEFEPACLDFHKTERSIRTPSSEQVRQPIFREGLFQWRNYEPWLGPLRSALGDALISYRQ